MLRLLAAGRSNQALARELVVSIAAVKTYLIHIYRKSPIPGSGKADRQVQGNCCLAATTFGIGKSEDLSHNTLPPLAATSYFLGIGGFGQKTRVQRLCNGVASYWSRNRTKALLVLLGFCWLLWQRRIGWFDRLGLHNPKVGGSIPPVATKPLRQ